MQDTIRYLREKKNRNGSCRYYWQPSRKLEDAGWLTVALPPERSLAIEAAHRENAKIDAWYAAGRPRRETARADREPDGSTIRGSVRDLVNLYRAPPEGVHADPEAEAELRAAGGRVFGYDYATLKKNSKRSYDLALDYIVAWMGPLPVKAVTEAIVLERLKAIARTKHETGPHKGRRKAAIAIHIGRVGRLLFHASRTLVAPTHPCYVRRSDNPWASLRAREQRRKPVLWTRLGRDLMIEAAEQMDWKSVATAIRINWWLGQREGDILALGHNFNPGEVLDLVQGKTAGNVYLPVGMVNEIGEAVAELRDAQRRRLHSGIRLLIDERNGLTWNENRFRKAFADIRACAVEEALWNIRHETPGWQGRDAAWVDRHLGELTYMRLRHTVVTMLYRAGATIPEIASITGHTIGSVTGIIERYGQRDAITAGNAMQKRIEREGQ